MRLTLFALCVFAATPLRAAPAPVAAPAPYLPAHPKSIGKYGVWQAATRNEGGQAICYVFTRPVRSAPRVPGRGDAVLTVTRRPNRADSVALSAGFRLTGHTDAVLAVGDVKLDFYIDGRSAFARQNAQAVAVLTHETSVDIHMLAPRLVAVTDHFSLYGFASAYAAMNKACPAGAAP
jgi:hypothetical protein